MRPGALRRIDQLGVGCIGIFRHRAPPKTMQHILRQSEPWFVAQLLSFCEKLIERIDAAHPDAGNGPEPLGPNALEYLFLSTNGSLIPIAERIGDGFALLIQAHIIHGPTIDRDRAHALARDLCTLAQTDVDLLRDLLQIPVQLTM